jgi:hypothetical protein
MPRSSYQRGDQSMMLAIRGIFGLGFGLVGLSAQVATQGAPPGQVARQLEQCLHGQDETDVEKLRREEALAAMRMIDWVLARSPLSYPRFHGWAELRGRREVRQLRAMDGRVGELARKLKWGDPEPLPDWGMSWMAADAPPRLPLAPAIVFALIDLRDPCLFRYSSTDPEVRTGPTLKLLQPDTY